MNHLFKDNYSSDARKEESTRITQKYPTRTPIIVERAKTCELEDIDKKKYLVPNDMTISQFVYIIRKRIKLKPEQALFVTINNCLPESNTPLSQIYEKHKDEDGFLYIVYSSENTFG